MEYVRKSGLKILMEDNRVDFDYIVQMIGEYKNGLNQDKKDMFIFFMFFCVCLVCFAFVFNAWYLSSYESIRSYAYIVAGQGRICDSLSDQYSDMRALFVNGSNSYVYHFGGLPIAVDSSFRWEDKAATIGYVIDSYSSIMYNINLGGDVGRINSIAGSGVHGIYQILLIILSLMIICISYLLYVNLNEYLLTCTKALFISAFITYILIKIISSLAIGSWVNAVDSDMYREALPIVFSSVQSQFVLSSIFYIVVAIIFGVVYVLREQIMF